MSRTDRPAGALEAKQRVEEGLEALRVGLAPYVARHIRDRHGPNWHHYASRARRDESSGDNSLILEDRPIDWALHSASSPARTSLGP